MKIWLKAAFLDLRPFLGDGTKKPEAERADNPPLILSVEADEMRTDDQETVRRGKI